MKRLVKITSVNAIYFHLKFETEMVYSAYAVRLRLPIDLIC